MHFAMGILISLFFLLRKGVYPYEYMDSWERFNETSWLDKEAFYSNLNKEDITDVHYRHAKRVFKNLSNKNLGDYHDLYAQSQGVIRHVILRYAKANNKYMKDYNKDEEKSFLQYNDANNLYGFAMSGPLLVDGFEWIRDLSKIDEDFIKNYDENSDKGYIREVDVEYPKNLHDFHTDLP